MSGGLEQLRLAAALAHSAADADVEVRGADRRWLVSYGRPDATIDPCGFRQLVLAAMKGCRVGILPADRVDFVGGLREIGGGVFQRRGEHGWERRFATFLPAIRVEALMTAEQHDAGAAMTAHVHADDELGVTVVSIDTPHLLFDHRLDVVALALVAACLVDEVIDASDREATT